MSHYSDCQHSIHGTYDNAMYQPLLIGEQRLPLRWYQIVVWFVCHRSHPLSSAVPAGVTPLLVCPAFTHVPHCQRLLAMLAVVSAGLDKIIDAL